MIDDTIMLERLRDALAGRLGVEEKRMMGGVCFMVEGHMLGGARVHKDGVGRFMFRVGKANEAEMLARPGARRVEMGVREMPGFVYVDSDDLDTPALHDCVALALDYLSGLPPKP